MSNLFENNGAAFSECRKYRYALWRIWDESKPLVMFIGLNPSTADESETDPTITRVINFAKDWGFGGVYMMNLFCYVTSKPEELPIQDEHDNRVADIWLQHVKKSCSKIIFAWGNFKVAVKRSVEVIKIFPEAYALIINKNGSPRHPLYIKANVEPQLYVVKVSDKIKT